MLDRRALGACRAQGIGRPATGFRFSLSATALTIRSGEAADLVLTVENTTSSTIRGSLEVPSELVGVMTMRVGTPRIDMECISGSGPVRTEPRPPPPPTLIEIELPAGGKLQWTQRVWATQVVNIIDHAKLAGFTGSGTPCIGREDPTPKGAYVLKVPSVFRWMPPYEVAVTVR